MIYIASLDTFEHGGNLYEAASLRGQSPHDLLDFSANINPLGLAESVKQAIAEHLPLIIHYPDAKAVLLKQAISEYYHVPVEQIIPGNGAVELLYLLSHHIRPKRVLIPAPSFSEYERSALAAGAAIDYYQLDAKENFALHVSAMMEQVRSHSIIFIGNPSNPTGTLISRDELKPLLKKAAELRSLVVLDESFVDFLLDDTSYTCRSLISEYPNLVVLHSMTKFFAMPGLRLGFALANPELIYKLHSCKDPWNVNSLAQAAGVAALKDLDYRVKSRITVQEASKELFRELKGISGLKPYTPTVNYILVNIAETGLTAEQLRNRLFEHNILVRDCSNYPGLSGYYIRTAVKLPEQNAVLISALKNILAVK